MEGNYEKEGKQSKFMMQFVVRGMRGNALST